MLLSTKRKLLSWCPSSSRVIYLHNFPSIDCDHLFNNGSQTSVCLRRRQPRNQILTVKLIYTTYTHDVLNKRLPNSAIDTTARCLTNYSNEKSFWWDEYYWLGNDATFEDITTSSVTWSCFPYGLRNALNFQQHMRNYHSHRVDAVKTTMSNNEQKDHSYKNENHRTAVLTRSNLQANIPSSLDGFFAIDMLLLKSTTLASCEHETTIDLGPLHIRWWSLQTPQRYRESKHHQIAMYRLDWTFVIFQHFILSLQLKANSSERNIDSRAMNSTASTYRASLGNGLGDRAISLSDQYHNSKWKTSQRTCNWWWRWIIQSHTDVKAIVENSQFVISSLHVNLSYLLRKWTAKQRLCIASTNWRVWKIVSWIQNQKQFQ